MPDEAPLTADATVCVTLFSIMERRRNKPRKIPNPKIAASSEPSIENPSFKEA